MATQAERNAARKPEIYAELKKLVASLDAHNEDYHASVGDTDTPINIGGKMCEYVREYLAIIDDEKAAGEAESGRKRKATNPPPLEHEQRERFGVMVKRLIEWDEVKNLSGEPGSKENEKKDFRCRSLIAATRDYVDANEMCDNHVETALNLFSTSIDALRHMYDLLPCGIVFHVERHASELPYSFPVMALALARELDREGIINSDRFVNGKRMVGLSICKRK